MEYKINTTLPISFEKVENPPYLNDSRWQMYKVWICHDLENYNGSYFDVSVLEKMGSKLAGVPVVGYISTNNINEKDFNGHEERLLIQDGDISIEYLGRAYGCVLENNDWKIEQKQHEDGSMRNYLTCQCLIWNMFSDAIEIFERDEKKSQSMELQEGTIQGKFEKDGYFHFSDATIRALCILGEGIPPAMSNSVIEKFSRVDFSYQVKELLTEINESIKNFSKIETKIDSYFIEKEKATELVNKADIIFKKLGFECTEWIVDGKEYQITGVINKTLNEEASKIWDFDIYDKDTITIFTNDLDKLDTSSIGVSSVELLLSKKENVQKFSLIPKKSEQSDFNIDSNRNGGNDLVDEKLELLKQYNLTVEQLEFDINEFSLEELENKLKEFSEKPKVEFSATYRQKRNALENALDPIIVKDDDGNYISETYFYVSDFSDEYVFVEKSYWDNKGCERTCGRFTYTFDTTAVTATITSEFEKMITDVWLTESEYQKLQEERANTSANYEKLQNEFEEYKKNYTIPNEEVQRLKDFESTKLAEERSNAETAIFTEFEDLKGIPEFETIKEKASEFSIEDLTEKCFAIRGKKNSSFSLNKPQKSTIKIGVQHNEEDNTDDPYGGLHSKYLK